jgi:hypothetical protein
MLMQGVFSYHFVSTNSMKFPITPPAVKDPVPVRELAYKTAVVQQLDHCQAAGQVQFRTFSAGPFPGPSFL